MRQRCSGPFQANEALAQVYFSLAHLFVLSGLTLADLPTGTNWKLFDPKLSDVSTCAKNNRTVLATMATSQHGAWLRINCTIDLIVANHWLLAEIPASVYDKEFSLDVRVAS